jgi:hypothetical protein
MHICRKASWIMFICFVPTVVLGKPELKLSVTFPNRVVAYSAVPLEGVVQNVGTSSVVIVQYEPGVAIEVRRARDGALVYEGPTTVSRLEEEKYIHPKVLKPNEQLSFADVVACSWVGRVALGQPLFRESGDYTLTAKRGIQYREDDKRQIVFLQTEPVPYSVVDPGPDEAAAFNEVRSLEQPCWLLEPQEAVLFKSPAQIQSWEGFLRKFVRDYPQSRWSPYAHLGLAYVCNEKGILRAGKVDDSALEEARQHLETVLAFKDFPLRGKAGGLRDGVLTVIHSESLIHLNKKPTVERPEPGNQQNQTGNVVPTGPMSEEEQRGISQESWEAIEPWRQYYQEQLKAGKITQKEVDQKLVVAQLKLVVAVRHQMREMRQKWKTGQITEQDYKQWLQQKAQELYQKENPSP